MENGRSGLVNAIVVVVDVLCSSSLVCCFVEECHVSMFLSRRSSLVQCSDERRVHVLLLVCVVFDRRPFNVLSNVLMVLNRIAYFSFARVAYLMLNVSFFCN